MPHNKMNVFVQRKLGILTPESQIT